MAYLIVVLAVLVRFVPHSPNFSPVFGALLFGGARLKSRDAVWFPLALLATSDVMLTTLVYHTRVDWMEPVLLAAFASVALIGRWLRERVSVRTVAAASLAGPISFFLISNFGVWLASRMYAPTWQGLLDCYGAGLPFFRNSLLSSVLFSGLLFGMYEFYQRKRALRGSAAVNS